MVCTRCGSSLQRLTRKGFLQNIVYRWFGYYPWQCPYCREPLLLKRQHQRKTHHSREPAAYKHSPHPAIAAAPPHKGASSPEPQPAFRSPQPEVVSFESLTKA